MKAELDRLRGVSLPSEFADPLAWHENREKNWKANAHVHLPPNFSAFDSVEQAVSLAAAQGISVLGASNYYDFEAYRDLAVEGRRRGIFPLFGLEIIALIEDLQRARVLINDPGNPGRMYICGKGIARFSPMTAAAEEIMTEIRQNDTARIRLMLERLEQIFAGNGLATGLSESMITESLVRRCGVHPRQVCLQERHLAQAFQEAFFELVPAEQRNHELGRLLGAPVKSGAQDPIKLQNEIRTHLMKVGKAAFVPERFVNFEKAYRLILELGGIPCYPILADGASPICSYEDPPEKLVESLKRNRVYCAEFIPIRNRPEVLEHYVRSVREAGLVVLAGTEHNTPDLIPLEPLCLGGARIPERIQEIFREGVCVAAAHQFLALHDRCGFVDHSGAPNPEFSSVEKRIDYFRRLGAAVIERYHEKNSPEE